MVWALVACWLACIPVSASADDGGTAAVGGGAVVLAAGGALVLRRRSRKTKADRVVAVEAERWGWDEARRAHETRHLLRKRTTSRRVRGKRGAHL